MCVPSMRREIHVKCCVRQPLYSNSMVIADRLLSTKAQHRPFKRTWLSKKGSVCQYFTSENILCLLLSLIYPAVRLLNKDLCELSVSRYSTWVMPKKGDTFPVHVFTGSGLITRSDRIGPDRARNWPFSSSFLTFIYNCDVCKVCIWS